MPEYKYTKMSDGQILCEVFIDGNKQAQGFGKDDGEALNKATKNLYYNTFYDFDEKGFEDESIGTI